jgi:DNA-binding response OmpR family regulator
MWLEPGTEEGKRGVRQVERCSAPERARVLVGHQDRTLRNRLAGALARDGHWVRAVEDGNAVLECIADALLAESAPPRPDLLLVEIDLPGRRGVDLLADLRGVGWTTPFVLIARTRHRELIASVRRFENAVVFEEPYETDDLRTAVTLLLGNAATQPERQPSRPDVEDRRGTPRATAHLWAEEVHDNEVYLIRVEDVSAGGVRLRHSMPKAHGSVCRLLFCLPGDPLVIDVMGRIVNQRQLAREYAVGVEFMGLKPVDRERIDSFIGQRRRRRAPVSDEVVATL